MNLYSIEFLPRVKLKFCQFFGIASDLAISELTERLESIDRKMDRFELVLKKIWKQQESLKKAQDSKVSLQKAQSRKPLPKLNPLQKPKRLLSKKPQLSVVVNSPQPSLEKKTKKRPQLQKSVLLISGEKEVSLSLQDYFGKEVGIIEAPALEQLPKKLPHEVMAVFYDRRLLGDSKNLEHFKTLKEKFPESKWVGLSNYLTLNLAQAAESQEEQDIRGHFINLPINSAELREIFTLTSQAVSS